MIQTNIDTFRAAFPEFSNSSVYTTSVITFWATLAEAQVRQCVWKTQWQTGVYLYIAHEITLATQNARTAANGGTPGTFAGPANTKTVDKATVGFDSVVTSEKDAGYWNLTTYGKQFFRLCKIFGAGAIQL